MIGAALGINGDVASRAEALLDAGIDCPGRDTAHGHPGADAGVAQIGTRSARSAGGQSRPPRRLSIAGNVVSADGVNDLLGAGARMSSKWESDQGHVHHADDDRRRPRRKFSAVSNAPRRPVRRRSIWADGGVRHPRDVALALAAGAGSVMIGSWFAGTYESTGNLMVDAEGRMYKESYGMASARAVKMRTKDSSGIRSGTCGLFEEGISTWRMYLDPDARALRT
jgi:IMP dehydrogenase